MEPAVWLEKAYDELVELGPSAEGKAGDAWRAVVLITRLLGSPAGPRPPAELVRRLPQLLAVAGSADVHDLLKRVAHHLDSDSDPWGPLLDDLLNVDDTLMVLGLSASAEITRALAQKVAGLVSLHPERILTLGSFAEMRLATLRDDAHAGIIWRAVERAPAQVLADALPVAEPKQNVLELASRRTDVVLPFGFPEELLRPAADSAPQEPIELKTEGSGRAWVYEYQGRMRLEATGLPTGPLSGALVAKSLEGVELRRVAVELEVAGGTAYAHLGPWAGAENVLRQLRAGTGLNSSELQIWLMVTSG